MSNVSPSTDTTRTEALEQRVAELERLVHELRAAVVGAGAALALGYASGKGATAASALGKVADAANAEADAIEAVRRLNAAKGEGAGR